MSHRKARMPGAVAGALFVGALALGACAADPQGASADPVDREERARQLISSVGVSASVAETMLAAAGASADFGIEEGVRRVNIRVVEEIKLEIRIVSERDVVLASAPVVCLVGPFWNPLDAGLSDRCWGDPDIGDVLADQLPTDEAGHRLLPGGQEIALSATLRRGDVRCDYAPGEWHLEIAASLLIDGSALDRMDVADVVVDVPFSSVDPLELLPPAETRVCSYAAAVYNRQGDPLVSPP